MQSSLEYLFPTSLTDRVARPSLKVCMYVQNVLFCNLQLLFFFRVLHYVTRSLVSGFNCLVAHYLRVDCIDVVFDKYNRPHDPGFYTGYPSFFDLKSKLYEILTEVIDNPAELRNENQSEAVKSTKWIKKSNMESLIGEEITDYQVM